MQMFVKILKESLRDDLKIDGYSWDDMHERLKEACGKADLVEFVSGLDMDRFVFFEKTFETCHPIVQTLACICERAARGTKMGAASLGNQDQEP